MFNGKVPAENTIVLFTMKSGQDFIARFKHMLTDLLTNRTSIAVDEVVHYKIIQIQNGFAPIFMMHEFYVYELMTPALDDLVGSVALDEETMQKSKVYRIYAERHKEAVQKYRAEQAGLKLS